MLPSSAKQKGRKHQQNIRDKILEIFPELSLNDVVSTPMGVSNLDIQLSDRARELFPYSVEAKCQEKLNIWSALEQSENNKEELTPIVVFKRNRSQTYVALKFDDFMNIIEKLKG